MLSAVGSARSTPARQCSKVATRMHALGNALGVERRDRVVVDQHVLPPRLVLELRHFGHELPVVRKERALRRKRARDERLANEDLTRGLRIDGAERHAPARHERQSVELHALARDDLATTFVPARVEVVARHPLARHRLDPLGLDPRRAAREKPRRFDELGRQHPFRLLLREARAGVQEEADAARAGVAVGVAVQRADVADEAREQRHVDRLVLRVVDGRRQRGRPLHSPATSLRSRAARARRAIRASAGTRRNARGRPPPPCGA